jgi:CHAD domain-containing protein
MTDEIPNKPLFGVGALLPQNTTLDAASVHHIRKGTKQLRARLQLLRQLEGQHQETEQLRQAVKELARMLAGQRNADVMYSLLQELIDACDDTNVVDLLTAMQDSLSSTKLPADEKKRISKLVHDIEHKTRRLAQFKYGETDINRVLAARLDSLLAAGPALLASSDWEALHDWRKQVKKLMYQYDMKPSPTPGDLHVYEQLDQLGNGLGKINDLSMLKSFVREREKHYTRAKALLVFDKVYAMIDYRRETQLHLCQDLFSVIKNQQ